MEVIVMKLLASCDIDKAKKFNGKLVLPNEDDKKPDKVFLNIVVDDTCEYGNDEIFRKASELGKDLVKCITFMVEKGRFANYVPSEWEGRVFNEYSDEYYYSGEAPICDKTVSLLRLQKGYSDMRKLYEVCKSHTDVRYIGGNILGIDGIRVGRFDEGKDKMSPVFKDIYDTFVEVDLNDLEGLQEIVKKTRKRAENLSGEKVKKPRVKKAKAEKKISKRKVAFNTLFAGDMEEEF